LQRGLEDIPKESEGNACQLRGVLVLSLKLILYVRVCLVQAVKIILFDGPLNPLLLVADDEDTSSYGVAGTVKHSYAKQLGTKFIGSPQQLIVEPTLRRRFLCPTFS
jgi:hypothetical protein